MDLDDCNPDFGTEALEWVRNDVERQSLDLARTDYHARAINYRHNALEMHYLAIAEIEARLTQIATDIRKVDQSGRSDLEKAIIREQMAGVHLTHLHSLRAKIRGLRGQQREMFEHPTMSKFARSGLAAVGRETLIASMTEIGSSTANTLGGRYSVYLSVTFNSAGELERGHGETRPGDDATEIGVALVTTQNFFAIIAGVVLIIGGTVLNAQCAAKWTAQREKVKVAVRELSSKLITEQQQWDLYSASEKAAIAEFRKTGEETARVLEKLSARWSLLSAATATRSSTYKTVLTQAKISEILRDLELGLDPVGLKQNVLLAEVVKGITEVNSYIGDGQAKVLSASSDLERLKLREDQLDAIDFADSQFRILRTQTSLIPLWKTIDDSASLVRGAKTELQDIAASSKDAISESDIVKKLNDFEYPEVFTEARVLGSPSHEKVAKLERRSKLQMLQNVEANYANIVAGGHEFKLIYSHDNGLTVGNADGGNPYRERFSTRGDPRQNVHLGANDGGFKTDERRLSRKVSAAKRNIDKRIESGASKTSKLIDVLPEWHAANKFAIDRTLDRVVQEIEADQSNEQTFVVAETAAIERIREDVNDFISAPFDTQRLGDLVRASGGADFALPDLPSDSIVPAMPEISGISASARAYGPGMTTLDQKVRREELKISNDLPKSSPSKILAEKCINEARYIARNGRLEDPVLAEALMRDASSIRYTFRGDLNTLRLSAVNGNGNVKELIISDIYDIPEKALLNVCRNFRLDQEFFSNESMQLNSELRSGAEFGIKRRVALDQAVQLAEQSSNSFYRGGIDIGRAKLTMAIAILDVATRFIPGIDWGRDVYEAFTGKDLFSGAELDTFDRVGAVIGVLTAGIGNNTLQIGKVLRMADKKVAELTDEVYEFAGTVDRQTESSLKYTDYALSRMKQPDRDISKAEILEVLDMHEPLWSVKHKSFTAVGHTSERSERIAVAIDVANKEIITVFPETIQRGPLELRRFKDSGKLEYKRLTDAVDI